MCEVAEELEMSGTNDVCEYVVQPLRWKCGPTREFVGYIRRKHWSNASIILIVWLQQAPKWPISLNVGLVELGNHYSIAGYFKYLVRLVFRRSNTATLFKSPKIGGDCHGVIHNLCTPGPARVGV